MLTSTSYRKLNAHRLCIGVKNILNGRTSSLSTIQHFAVSNNNNNSGGHPPNNNNRLLVHELTNTPSLYSISNTNSLRFVSPNNATSTGLRWLSDGGGKDTEKEEDEQEDEESKGKDEEEEETELSPEEKLQNQVKDYKDQLLRSLAEQENIRRIAKRDVDSGKSFAITSFAKSLLETYDNLTRALEAVDDDNSIKEGIQMTLDGLKKAFAKHGLKQFGSTGDKFDPNLHEALYEYDDDKLTPGTIGQVTKVGFKLQSRVIRPAEVGVIKKK